MLELIHHFGLDWKLLLAQVVNFTILVLVLKKFAYEPILRTLQARKDEIEQGLRNAELSKERLQQIEEERERTLQKARAESLSVVKTAEKEAANRKETLLAEARAQSANVIEEAKRAAARERTNMEQTVYTEAHALIKEGIAKVLGGLPPETRDGKLITEAVEAIRKTRNS